MKRNNSWYVEWFGEDYLTLYEHRDHAEAVKACDLLIRATGLLPGSSVLDVGCGRGRHANELARRGYRVFALDRSDLLLRLAALDSKTNGLGTGFVLGDMKHLPFTGSFDLASSFFTSFGYFESEEENQQVLSEISIALKPEGRFCLDLANRDHVLSTLVERDTRKLETGSVTQERRYDPESRRVIKNIEISCPCSTRNYTESVRLYTLEEMERMTGRTGLVIRKVFGDYGGGEFLQSSPRMILIGTGKG